MKIISPGWFGSGIPGAEAQRPTLYRVAYAWCHDAALAEDLVQETLTKAWIHREQLRENGALKAWLMSIMNRCWMDQLRRTHEFENIEDWQDELESPAGTPEAHFARDEVVACVRAAVAQLSPGQRQVLSLVDLEEFGYAEVACILDIPVGTVMSRLSRARAALKLSLGSLSRKLGGQPVLRRVK